MPQWDLPAGLREASEGRGQGGCPCYLEEAACGSGQQASCTQALPALPPGLGALAEKGAGGAGELGDDWHQRAPRFRPLPLARCMAADTCCLSSRKAGHPGAGHLSGIFAWHRQGSVGDRLWEPSCWENVPYPGGPGLLRGQHSLRGSQEVVKKEDPHPRLLWLACQGPLLLSQG